MSLTLVVVLLFTFTTAHSFGMDTKNNLGNSEAEYNIDGYDIKVIEDNENSTLTATCEENDKMYEMKYDYDTEEFTYNVISEAPWYTFGLGKEQESSYDVVVENASPEGILDAKIVDENGKVIEKIDRNMDDVTIQAPIAIAGIGAALLAALIATGKAIIVAGVAWIIASELASIKKKNSKVYYYQALIKDHKVYFRKTLTKKEAQKRMKTKNSKGHYYNVIATTAAKAKSLCVSLSPVNKAQYEGAHKKACGERKHYHVVKNLTKNKKGIYTKRIYGHCFY